MRGDYLQASALDDGFNYVSAVKGHRLFSQLKTRVSLDINGSSRTFKHVPN